MSQLGYMEKLLDGVEVEWKPLGEVCDFKNGFAFKSSLFKETGLPIIRITNIESPSQILCKYGSGVSSSDTEFGKLPRET
ncbi:MULTISPECIES: hypothetical protein [unclassified Psychrobacter]|uniref:hypothetical protein n=1 Tax=unclassified Psychrobacter TaxID=196806 RepID=UPI00402B4852